MLATWFKWLENHRLCPFIDLFRFIVLTIVIFRVTCKRGIVLMTAGIDEHVIVFLLLRGDIFIELLFIEVHVPM